MMSFLSSLMVVITLLVAPFHQDQSVTELVKWSGCEAAIVTSDEYLPIDSAYDYANNILYIGTKDAGMPDFVLPAIVAHELGHCLQDQADGIYGRPGVEIELEADMLAANLMCARGLDGSRIIHDLFVWANAEYAYDGDPGHGTLAERIAAGYAAPICKENRASQGV